MKFHHIRFSNESKAKGSQRHAVFNSNPPSALLVLFVNPFVHYPAFSRQTVFGPQLFNVNQGTLAFAEQQVLEAGKGKEVVPEHTSDIQLSQFFIESNIFRQIIPIHGDTVIRKRASRNRGIICPFYRYQIK